MGAGVAGRAGWDNSPQVLTGVKGEGCQNPAPPNALVPIFPPTHVKKRGFGSPGFYGPALSQCSLYFWGATCLLTPPACEAEAEEFTSVCDVHTVHSRALPPSAILPKAQAITLPQRSFCKVPVLLPPSPRMGTCYMAPTPHPSVPLPSTSRLHTCQHRREGPAHTVHERRM